MTMQSSFEYERANLAVIRHIGLSLIFHSNKNEDKKTLFGIEKQDSPSGTPPINTRIITM